ncbi:pyridoxamine 5'-phosphate oxidase family protein [Actinokineospora inagensis]|uniref:pyridoxamine 5'-phosphate oxidase family protein n=1 Tax=Actinokineospora inagensis TaxID=103730 RepID=UPI000424DB72|nr:pyridoxamine 5'-phosphate oxidase family protein [Actinokineospora inagensis]
MSIDPPLTRELRPAPARPPVLDRLTPEMVALVHRMDRAFLATADADGECDFTLCAGPRGFVQVLDDRRLACPELEPLPGLANLAVNPRLSLLLVDGDQGLHVNGHACVVDDAWLRVAHPGLPTAFAGARWAVLVVDEAYLHSRSTAG